MHMQTTSNTKVNHARVFDGLRCEDYDGHCDVVFLSFDEFSLIARND